MNKRYRSDFLQAGEIAKEVRAYGKELIKAGASYNEVIKKIHAEIIRHGARAAFPPQIALNEVAAHFLPMPGQDIIFSDQVVKLDIGVCLNGAIGDCAVTIDLSGKYQKLIDAVEAALKAAEQSVKAGMYVREIGKIIDETITSYGFKPIKNLCGHGLGYFKIHTSPSIPNCDDHSHVRLRPGTTFAIEPFATDGVGSVEESGDATIFSFLQSRPVYSPISKSLLTKIRTFDGLPFAIHDLLSLDLSLKEVQFGLKELINSGVITGYPPLLEMARGFVAQAENSVLLDESGEVLISSR